MQPPLEQSVYPAPLRPEEVRAALQPNQFGSETYTACQPGLPALPLTLAEMELLLQEPVIDLGAIAEVAKRDASLAARLLLLANHDREASDRFYRIEDCLVQLGTAALRQLVRKTPSLGASDWRGGALQSHSRQTALAAEAIAFHVPSADPEQAYLAGLLHLFPELFPREIRVEERAAIFGGSDVWPLPAFILEVIRGFRHPFVVSGRESLLCSVVLAACEWVSQSVSERSPESPLRPNSHLTKAP